VSVVDPDPLHVSLQGESLILTEACTVICQYPAWVKLAVRVAFGDEELPWLMDSLSPPGDGPHVMPLAEYCTFVTDQLQLGMPAPLGGLETEADSIDIVLPLRHTGFGMKLDPFAETDRLLLFPPPLT
jgi:hypothetical protein